MKSKIRTMRFFSVYIPKGSEEVAELFEFICKFYKEQGYPRTKCVQSVVIMQMIADYVQKEVEYIKDTLGIDIYQQYVKEKQKQRFKDLPDSAKSLIEKALEMVEEGE